MKLILVVFTLYLCLFVNGSRADDNTLTIYVFAGGKQAEAIHTVAEKYREMHPKFTLNVKRFTIPQYTELTHGDDSSLGDADILSFAAGTHFRDWASQARFAALDDVWKTANLDQYFSIANKTSVSVNNTAYGLPISRFPMGLIIKRSIFNELNIEPPQTWESFLAACEALKKKGIAPIVIGTQNRWPAAAWFDYLNLRMNGIDFHREVLAGKVSFYHPRLMAVFQSWKLLIDRQYYIENAQSKNDRNVLPYVMQGKAGFLLTGSYAIEKIPESLREDMDIIRFPSINSQMPIYENAQTDLFVVPAKSKNIALTKAFLTFVAKPESLERYNKILKTYSPVKTQSVPNQRLEANAFRLFSDVEDHMNFFNVDAQEALAEPSIGAFTVFIEDGNIQKLTASLEAYRLALKH